jgi:predicted TIM-barrel fold metal-dependent hydrolase
MRTALQKLEDSNVVLAATSGPEEFLERWSIEEPDRLMLGPIFPCDGGLNPNWKRYRCFRDGGEFPDLGWLETQYQEGTYQIMGELMNQYAGVPYDDPRMAKYYELAERLGIPVAIHTHSAPPMTASNCCPKFRISLGNPILLEEVLVRYPKLKVQMMHANPLVHPLVLDMMIQYPAIYVDVSQFQRIMPREQFHRLLAAFKESRLLGRVMFGSDGDDYESALEAYRSADFLSERELEGIFCRNAARFLDRQGVCDP